MRSFTATDPLPANVRSSEGLASQKLQQHVDQLLALHGPALARLAGSYTDTLSDRDDLLQEIALAVWQALGRFRGECSERTFLFRIAHNRGIAFLARHKARMSPLSAEVEVPDPAPDPESGLAQEQRAARLTHAVHQLPLGYRQVITLVLEGLSYEEIAQVLGISESNVGVRLSRARQMLREALERWK